MSKIRDQCQPEMESSRPWPWPRGSSRPANGVLGLGLEGQVLGLGFGLACGGLDSKSGVNTYSLGGVKAIVVYDAALNCLNSAYKENKKYYYGLKL